VKNARKYVEMGSCLAKIAANVMTVMSLMEMAVTPSVKLSSIITVAFLIQFHLQHVATTAYQSTFPWDIPKETVTRIKATSSLPSIQHFSYSKKSTI